MRLGAVGVGAGEEHEHIGPRPRRCTRSSRRSRATRPRCGVAAVTIEATSEPKSGSVTATAFITSPDGQARQP